MITGRARDVLAAADAVLTASGTASLEALLLKRPMVVAHRIAPLTYWLVRRLGVAKLTHFSLPNLLAGDAVVPEFVQGEVRADVLGPAVLEILDGRPLHAGWYDVFTGIHRQLRRDAEHKPRKRCSSCAATMTGFVHLRVHTEYSLVDSVVRVDSLIECSSGSDAGLRDHRSRQRVGDGQVLSRGGQHGIKPIIGADVSIAESLEDREPTRLTLLCQNRGVSSA